MTELRARSRDASRPGSFGMMVLPVPSEGMQPHRLAAVPVSASDRLSAAALGAPQVITGPSAQPVGGHGFREMDSQRRRVGVPAGRGERVADYGVLRRYQFDGDE
jgi:hypothetical protein